MSIEVENVFGFVAFEADIGSSTVQNVLGFTAFEADTGASQVENVIAFTATTALGQSNIESIFSFIAYTEGVPLLELQSLSLSIENNVSVSDKYVPLTGIYATGTTIDGWIWDRRRLENERYLQTQYDTFLGGHEDGLTDGTYLTQWQSGTIRGTKYQDLAHYRNVEFLTWTPRVEVGAYSLHHDRRPLYSDYSVSGKFSVNAIENGAMWFELRNDAVYSTVNVAMYSRDDKSRIFKKIDFNYVDQFTGIIESGQRVDADDGTTVQWTKLETRKPEFIIRDGRVVLNDDWSMSVGLTTDGTDLALLDPAFYDDFLEPAGSGVGSGRDIFLRYFPIEPGSVRLFTKDAANNIQEWTEQDNLNFSELTDKHFSVDYDLGIITTGGFQAPNLVVSEAVDKDDVEITVYVDDESISQYPHQGIITIGSEKIAYYSRTRNVFYNLIRGYDNTIAADHAVGAVVIDAVHGEGTDDNLYVAYTAVPRVDYEITGHNYRSANKSPWLDIRPGVNVETNNILQILSADINLQEVVLETDTALIGGELHGDLYYGSDVSRLVARGLDALGNPVEDIDLSIEILSGPGLLNGIGTSFTSISNTLGEIYAFYNTPYDRDDIEKTVSSIVHNGANTEMTVDGLEPDTVLNNIWVFQIFKHDKITGTVGEQFDITAAAVSTGAFAGLSPGYIEIDGLVNKDDFLDGYIIVIGTDSIQYTRNIVTITTLRNGNDQPYSRIYLDNTLSAGIVVGQTVRIYEPDAVAWNASALNGTRHIVYEFRNDIPHPITNELGAYYPLQPDSISGNVITFNNRNLPIPDKNDPAVNLGGYVVITTGLSTLQAYGRDPISGRVVRSNIIKLRLILPNSLIGVDTSGVLPVPIGWTFVSEEFNVGSGIGGANFITINPAADGINQFNLLGIF